MENQKIERVVKQVSYEELSTATFGDWELQFTVKRDKDRIIQLTYSGSSDNGNKQISGGLYNGDMDRDIQITFSPISCTDVDVASAIMDEVNAIKSDHHNPPQ